jgi:hypothetical protein
MNELRFLHLTSEDGQYQIALDASDPPDPASLTDFSVMTVQPGQEGRAYYATLSQALHHAAAWVHAREAEGPRVAGSKDR